MVPRGYGDWAVTEEAVAAMLCVVGAVVARIRRVFYVHQGATNTAVGALELRFTDGRLLLVDSGPDGEALAVAAHEWEDPFTEDRMTPENRSFVTTSGKWTAVDLSNSPEYEGFLGAVVLEIAPIMSANGKIVGAILGTSNGDIRAEVEADDLYVQVG